MSPLRHAGMHGGLCVSGADRAVSVKDLGVVVTSAVRRAGVFIRGKLKGNN